MNITDETVTIDNKQTGIKTVTKTVTTIVNVYDNFPYVTSSLKTKITDSQFLTGDAVSKRGYTDTFEKNNGDDNDMQYSNYRMTVIVGCKITEVKQ